MELRVAIGHRRRRFHDIRPLERKQVAASRIVLCNNCLELRLEIVVHRIGVDQVRSVRRKDSLGERLGSGQGMSELIVLVL
jgi:hypothetical protein